MAGLSPANHYMHSGFLAKAVLKVGISAYTAPSYLLRHVAASKYSATLPLTLTTIFQEL